MKRVLPYYFVPTCIFLLLSIIELKEPTVQNLFMTLISSIAIGVFAGFILHIAIIIMKKIS